MQEPVYWFPAKRYGWAGAYPSSGRAGWSSSASLCFWLQVPSSSFQGMASSPLLATLQSSPCSWSASAFSRVSRQAGAGASSAGTLNTLAVQEN